MLGRLFATWYELDTKVEPKAKAMAQVRAKPVMREMMTQMEMRAAEAPTDSADSPPASTTSSARATSSVVSATMSSCWRIDCSVVAEGMVLSRPA